MDDDPDNPYRAPNAHGEGIAASDGPPGIGRGFRWQVIPATLCVFVGALLTFGVIVVLEQDLLGPGVDLRRPGVLARWLSGFLLCGTSAAAFLRAGLTWARPPARVAVLWTIAGVVCYALSGVLLH